MPKEHEVQEFYFNTRDIAESLEPGSTERVDREFNINPYPDEKYSNMNEFASAAYGLSSVLADSFHDKTGKIFYGRRADEFGEFVREKRSTGDNKFMSGRYITLANFYSEIAEDADEIESDYPSGTNIALEDTSSQKEIVFDMVGEISDELTTQSSISGQPGPVS